MQRSRRRFDRAFKVEAVRLVSEKGHSLSQVARDLDVRLRTREGWLYLAVLLDLCSRFVVGWSLSSRLEQELTLQALERAVAQRQPGPGILHHSDRGCQ